MLGYDCPLVEITGGEPLLQKNVLPLMTMLADAGRTVLLETSGAHDISAVDPRVHRIMDLKTPGSGEAVRNLFSNLEYLAARDEVKFVIADMNDWEFAKGVIDKYGLQQRAREVLISPVHGIEDLVGIAEAVSRSGINVRLNLQLHKYIWGADARGV